MNQTSSRNNYQLKKQLAIKLIRSIYAQNKTLPKQLSATYRKDLEIEGKDTKFLTYGEVEPASFLQLLELIQDLSTHGLEKFVDLGSGSGLACLTAALSPIHFKEIIGIEIVPALCDLSKSLLESILVILANKDISEYQPQPNKTEVSSEINLNLYLKDYCDNNVLPISINSVADYICKTIGHKKYKTALKKYKTFQKYLLTQQFIKCDNKFILECIPPILDEKSEETLNDIEIDAFTEDNLKVDLNETSDNIISHNNFFLSIENKALFFPFPSINLLEDSIFAIDWWVDTDVAYAASLLFSEEMMEKLKKQVLNMKPGSFFISLKPLPISKEMTKIELLEESFFKMSWQMAKVYIYKIN